LSRTDDEFAGAVALLDFLMGSSMSEVTQRYRLDSIQKTEALIRAVLLLHGYDVMKPRSQ
jgi:hypothetical protein